MSIIQMIVTRKWKREIIKMIRISVKIKKPTIISNQIRKETTNSMKEIINLALPIISKAQSPNKCKILSNLRPNPKMNLILKNKFRTTQAPKSQEPSITRIDQTATKSKRINAKRRMWAHYTIIQNIQWSTKKDSTSTYQKAIPMKKFLKIIWKQETITKQIIDKIFRDNLTKWITHNRRPTISRITSGKNGARSSLRWIGFQSVKAIGSKRTKIKLTMMCGIAWSMINLFNLLVLSVNRLRSMISALNRLIPYQ